MRCEFPGRVRHYFFCPKIVRRIIFMNKASIDQSLLRLLVRVYNQSIQFYYYFPDVIICGQQRLEREEFEYLLAGGYLTAYHTDSFGKLYHLSGKADRYLHENLHKRRHRAPTAKTSSQQTVFFFNQS